MAALYELYTTIENILKTVTDPNTERAAKTGNKNRWIYPDVPTGMDKYYPRIVIEFLNIEEEPLTAGGYLSDNFQSDDTVKSSLENAKLYYVTMWVGLFVKTELNMSIAKPDGTMIEAKNTLLANLLFEQMIDAIDANKDQITAVSYNYRPFMKQYTLGYQDNTNRIVNAMTIRIPVLSATEIVYDDDNLTKLIEEINENYEVEQA